MKHARVTLKKQRKIRKSFAGLFLFSFLLLISVIAVSAFFTLYTNDPVSFYNRETGKMEEEQVPGKYWIRWLYNAPVGKVALNTIVSRKLLTEYYGKMMDKPSSVKRIPDFIEELDIDMTPFPRKVGEYQSFNDFFTRRIDPAYRPIDRGWRVVTSPADSKVLGFSDLSKDRKFPIKGFDYDLASMLDNANLAVQYEQGSMLIFRLTPADYHRFHFPIDGIPGETRKIDGRYYSVSPLALQKMARAFSENKREYCVIESDTFGQVVMMEIGSTLTGGIQQNYVPGKQVAKGDEKGYFFFGGSTVILLFEPDVIRIDADILERSRIRIETAVKMGEHVAKKRD